jgi:acyl-CoA hydrolase
LSQSLINQGYQRTLQKLIFGKHLNAAQTLFGGQLLSWIDEASAMFAIEYMGTRRVLTKKISEVIFVNPGLSGDLIQFWCKAVRDGKTSMTLELIIETMNVESKQQREICTCQIVYVAVDELGKPTRWKN